MTRISSRITRLNFAFAPVPMRLPASLTRLLALQGMLWIALLMGLGLYVGPMSSAQAEVKTEVEAREATLTVAHVDHSVGRVKLDLIKALEADGYLSAKLAQQARLKFIDPTEMTVPAADSTEPGPSMWSGIVSWSNFFRVLAVVAFLVFFGSWISRLALLFAAVIMLVPVGVYQAVFAAVSLALTVYPGFHPMEHGIYLALFGAFAFIIVLAWIACGPMIQAMLSKLFVLGLPPASVISFAGMLYFAALALGYQSQIFGFFAAVCLSGMFTFVVYYRPGILMLDFNDRAMPAVVFGHLAVLSAYVGMKVAGALPEQTALFAVGIEYYTTMAMGVGFLVAASPFQWRSRGAANIAYLALFIALASVAVFGYFFWGIQVIASIVCVFGVLLSLEWYGKLSYKGGFLFGTFMVGVALYAMSMLIESYGHLVVLRLT